MTKEQAIKWLKAYIQDTPFQMEQYERAFEMAISALNSLEEVYAKGYNDGFTQAEVNFENDKALSQESEIEENIIKYMKKYPNHVGNTDFWEGFYACRNVVLQLDDEEYAPKEQEPKSGKWIETEYHRWRCSVCREKGMSEWDNIHAVRTNYCPNCGAKMESEDKK